MVDFTVPSKANLKIEWAQAGNHDFALYTNVERSGRLRRWAAGELHVVDWISRRARSTWRRFPAASITSSSTLTSRGAEGGVVCS